MVFSNMDIGAGSTPYTMNEWIWAAQGGYLDKMVDHFIQNGGL